MSLSEKITALRTGLKLSQGDVAEKLEVSRQSVSKWETGQSVPELDKIVKLADLFGVSVDELVRDGEVPRPNAAPPRTGTEKQKVTYIGLRYTPAQALGILLIAGGLLMILCAAFVRVDALLCIGGALSILGLPLLLAKKHPLLIDGWIVWLVGYFALVISYYRLLGGPISPLYGFTILPQLLTAPLQESDLWVPVVALLYLAYLLIAVLTVLLPIFTVWACLRRHKTRKETE